MTPHPPIQFEIRVKEKDQYLRSQNLAMFRPPEFIVKKIEENRRIGVCKTCHTFVTEENQSKSEDLEVVSQINFNTVSKPPLKKQKTLDSLFVRTEKN